MMGYRARKNKQKRRRRDESRARGGLSSGYAFTSGVIAQGTPTSEDLQFIRRAIRRGWLKGDDMERKRRVLVEQLCALVKNPDTAPTLKIAAVECLAIMDGQNIDLQGQNAPEAKW